MKRDNRIPEKEWKLLPHAAKKVQGSRRGHYFNSSLGCASGGNCRFKHLCVVCRELHVADLQNMAQELLRKKSPLDQEEVLSCTLANAA